ncbi:hypothetical protein TNCV_2863061 [Trichonephila clavipes]|nr:hypothetical protein TNCV_2863061 [Trichonephila clavipes]
MMISELEEGRILPSIAEDIGKSIISRVCKVVQTIGRAEKRERNQTSGNIAQQLDYKYQDSFGSANYIVGDNLQSGFAIKQNKEEPERKKCSERLIDSKWLGHLYRYVDAFPTKNVTFSKIKGTRRRGRPPTRWLDDVEKVLTNGNQLGKCINTTS